MAFLMSQKRNLKAFNKSIGMGTSYADRIVIIGNKIMNEIHEKATFYLGDLWGYDRIETRDVSWIFEPYAQHHNAARIEYTVRGKRKRKTAIITTQPLVILDGWGHPDPPPKYSPLEQTSGNFKTQSTRRPSCDPEWEHEFNAFLNGYLAGSKATVLADFRKHGKIKEEN